jgi:hypothetical protein
VRLRVAGPPEAHLCIGAGCRQSPAAVQEHQPCSMVRLTSSTSCTVRFRMMASLHVFLLVLPTCDGGLVRLLGRPLHRVLPHIVHRDRGIVQPQDYQVVVLRVHRQRRRSRRLLLEGRDVLQMPEVTIAASPGAAYTVHLASWMSSWNLLAVLQNVLQSTLRLGSAHALHMFDRY